MSMGKQLQIQAHSAEERACVERVARARTAQARQVERAKVVLAARQGAGVRALAQRVDLSPATVYLGRHRFETQGLAGLADKPRGGRPPTYMREPVSPIVATALTDPPALGQASSSWTRDRLAAYVAAHAGSTMQRSRLDELVLAEGLRWRKPESWFGERVDPACAQQRGRENRCRRVLPQAAAWSVWMRWGRKRPRVGRESGCCARPPARSPAVRRDGHATRATLAADRVAPSLAPSSPRPGRPARPPLHGGQRSTGLIASRTSRPGSSRPLSASPPCSTS
jgi:transposase